MHLYKIAKCAGMRTAPGSTRFPERLPDAEVARWRGVPSASLPALSPRMGDFAVVDGVRAGSRPECFFTIVEGGSPYWPWASPSGCDATSVLSQSRSEPAALPPPHATIIYTGNAANAHLCEQLLRRPFQRLLRQVADARKLCLSLLPRALRRCQRRQPCASRLRSLPQRRARRPGLPTPLAEVGRHCAPGPLRAGTAVPGCACALRSRSSCTVNAPSEPN